MNTAVSEELPKGFSHKSLEGVDCLHVTIYYITQQDMQAIIVKKRKAEMDEIEKREREKKLERLKEKVI